FLVEDNVGVESHQEFWSTERLVETDKLALMDLSTLEVSEPKLLWPSGDYVPLSFSYNPPTQRLYMIVRHLGDAFEGALQVEERTLDGALVGQPHTLPKCAGATDSHYPATTARSLIEPSFLYLNCYGSNGVQSQIVRIDLGENSKLDPGDAEEIFPALPGPLSTIFDPGSDRMFFLTANRGAGRGAWVFDGLRDSFLGVIATGDTEAGQDYSIGLDESTGRIYMQTPAGFVIADGRRTPLPGRLLFKEFAGNGFNRIQVDPVKRQIFVADVEGLSLPTRYKVLKDSIPVSFDPRTGDPDSLTADVDEKSGLTDVNLAASARAFAVRSLTTGGTQRAAWNASIGTLVSPDDRPELSALMDDTVPLDAGNRDLYLARIRKVALAGRDTEASAIFAEADDATASDIRYIDRTSENDSIKREGLNWPYSPTSCIDSGQTPSSTVDDRSPTSASCDSGASAVFASTGADKLVSLDSTFSVSATASTGAVYRDPMLGLVAFSEAVIQGISIANVVRIGELRTVATTWAKGRKGRAGAKFDRRLGDVSVDTDGNGTFDFHCGSGMSAGNRSCDLTSASAAIAKALEGKASIVFPEPDPTFSKGSSGGYQSVIEKQRFQSYSDRSLNDDDSPEVVGMQIVYYADAKAGRSRQVIQLAGVQAESHYGIYLLPGTSGNSDLGSSVGDTFGSWNLTPSISGEPIDSAVVPVLGVSKARFDRVIEKIAAGWRFLLASASDAIKLGALWLLFLLPLYLISRRRFITV
ncbi:MAG TPA: hypothetical protein VNA87_03185, partial [Actinomycetota bacterium]|nr:hypothetical protein [Actinomycetota bacterium]